MFGVGKFSAKSRVITATGGGGLSRSGTSDSNHVHTISALNTLYMIPNIVYVHHTTNVKFNFSAYSVKDILFTSGSNASHTFYLATKIKQNTSTFHNDICVGAIQIQTASSVVFAGGAEDVSVFTTASDQTTTTDPTDGSLTFISIPSATSSTPPGGRGRWQKASETSSRDTGAVDSISTTFQNTNNPLNNAGSGVIAQTHPTASDFIYSETSSCTLNNFCYLKFTVSLATNTAHKFVFAYNFGTKNDDTGDDKDDNVGIYIEN